MFSTAGFLNAAQTEIVTNTNDSGPGSLRNAITNVSQGGNIVVKQDNPTSDNTIQLLSQLDINKDISIDGQDKTDGKILVLQGIANTRITNIAQGVTATISNTIFAKGKCWGEKTGDGGGGILNQGNLTLDTCIVMENTVHAEADYCCGGGILNLNGNLTLHNCDINFNNIFPDSDHPDTLCGGGICSKGGIVIVDNTDLLRNILHSAATGTIAYGGGIYIENGTLVLISSAPYNVSLSSNSACDNAGNDSMGFGGGISAKNATIIVLPPLGYSTDTARTVLIADNRAEGNGARGGGIYLDNSTITGSSYIYFLINIPDNIDYSVYSKNDRN